MKPKVFISYSHQDAEWARRFAEDLEEHGVDIWFDQFDVPVGESLREAFEKGLRESDVIVLVFNADSIKRPSVLFELGAAVSMGKRIIAVVPNDLDASLLPQSVRLRRYLSKETPEETAEKLVSETFLAEGKS